MVMLSRLRGVLSTHLEAEVLTNYTPQFTHVSGRSIDYRAQLLTHNIWYAKEKAGAT
jgi:hypothetical protein